MTPFDTHHEPLMDKASVPLSANGTMELNNLIQSVERDAINPNSIERYVNIQRNVDNVAQYSDEGLSAHHLYNDNIGNT